ncbi:MAG: GNAT family N-acetyltransferase [Deltaproteobacteria bacterium]|jgi:predicted GNAT family N-acyltransferase|nr:GNAT family N-acetyltransferase [Deltaproteobacteria bacterium]
MNVTVITKLNDEQITKLNHLYQNERVTKDRNIEDIKLMLEKTSYVFGFCEPSTNELIGFARVITDSIYKAFIFDVLVDSEYRNKGLGKVIMNTILDHPVIKKVEHIELYCQDKMVPYYEQMGFKTRQSLLLRKEMLR